MSVDKNLTNRAHVTLPIDFMADIDKLVGKRGRSSFISKIVRDEIQRRQQRTALQSAKDAWIGWLAIAGSPPDGHLPS